MTDTDNEPYCSKVLLDEDRDRYLTALFALPVLRPRLHALYAFNLELAKVADVVSEPMLGEIRLQWWREALDGIQAGAPRHHAVVEALAGVIAEAALEREPFDRMIDARARALEEAPFATLGELTGYLRDTSSALMALAAESLSPGTDTGLATSPAAAGGIAWGLTGIIRSVGFHASQGRCMLPRDRLQDHNLDAHDLVHRRMSEGLATVIEDLVREADRQLARFSALAPKIPRAAVPAYLPVALARSDLKAIRRAHFDPFRMEGPPRPGRLLNLMIRGYLARP